MKVPRSIIEFIGRMKIHRHPPWFIYRPNEHKVRGSSVFEVMKTVQFGDPILRRFDGYLSTIIPEYLSKGGGFWSHAGMYVGMNCVVHFLGNGCKKETIIDFCRADAISVLQILDDSEEFRAERVCRADEAAAKNIGYDFGFQSGNRLFYCSEGVDMFCDGIFAADYEIIRGNRIITPTGMFRSNKVKPRISINYNPKK